MSRAEHAWVLAMGFLAMALAASVFVKPAPKLIWNASASTPVGLYMVQRNVPPEVTDLVAAMPPEPLARFLAERGYIGAGLPLLKRVLGLPGQRVCRTGTVIRIDGIVMGEALERDRKGRALPVWQGCRVVGDGEFFLMNWDVTDSFDGRYFGPIPASAVIGKAVPLWTDEQGDGRYQWRAATR